MSIKQEVAYGIVKSLTAFWRCEELQDFTVEAGSVHFGCHRLLLAACSEFFRGLFRSGMKETEQKKVTLKDISSETFELIMESMYTGHGILTKDNLMAIWRAAHSLQIDFLLLECENFVLNTLSLDNYAEYFYTSNLLNSAVVLERLWPFVLKNCNSFFQTSYFLELPLAVVLSLIKSQDLETKSEDDVIRAILKWAEFQGYHAHISDVTNDGNKYSCQEDNDKEKEITNGDISCSKKCKNGQVTSTVIKVGKNVKMDFSGNRNNQDEVPIYDITILLSHSRACLASQRCLEMLIRHPLVIDNQGARDIVIDALLYQLQGGKGNGQWPSRAVHRNNSHFLHCIVTTVSVGHLSQVMAYSIARKKWYAIGNKSIKRAKFAVVNHELYAIYNYCNVDRRHLSLLSMEPTRLYFCRVMAKKFDDSELPLMSADFCVAVVDSFVYIFLEEEQTVWELDVNSGKNSEKSILPGHENIAYLLAYGHSILVFYASKNERVGETIGYCFDTVQNTWTVINPLKGKADGMTSFEDDHFTYLLQSNGNLWKVVKQQLNIVDFEFVARFWNCDMALHGAVTYLGDLYIGIHPPAGLPDDRELMRSLPGVFEKIFYHAITSNDKAMFLPILLSEKVCEKKQVPAFSLSQNINCL